MVQFWSFLNRMQLPLQLFHFSARIFGSFWKKKKKAEKKTKTELRTNLLILKVTRCKEHVNYPNVTNFLAPVHLQNKNLGQQVDI